VITALTLLVLFRKYPVANRSQIVALAGLDPIQFQSGISVHGKTRISKRGNRELRKRLYQATLSAARYNPNVRAIYRRLKEQGKPDKVARIAAARKLLLIAHAIYKSGEMYHLPNEKEG
jgi:transposase